MKKKVFALVLAMSLLSGCSTGAAPEETAAPETTMAEAAAAETMPEESSIADFAAAETVPDVVYPVASEVLAQELAVSADTVQTTDGVTADTEEEPIPVPLSHGCSAAEYGDVGQITDSVTDSSAETSRRPAYDMGNCGTMEGDVFTITLFLDDAESSWDEESIWRFWSEALIPGYDYLEREASERGIPLNFESSCYYTGMNEGLSVRYNGTAADANNNTFQTDMDMLSQVLQTMGFASEADFRQRMVDFSGCEDVVVTIALNKPGRSFSWCNSLKYVEFFECCIVFSQYNDTVMDVCPCTVVHETLHLFGAEDYYDPYGKMPNRKQMADRLYPNDIMYQPYVDVSYNEIGSFTEFTIGWRDELPAQCDTDLWWS